MTAMAMVALGLWFVVTVLRLLHTDFATARTLMGQPWNAILLIAFVITMFWHAVLGLQVVIEDYVHTRWKEVSLLVLVKFLAVLGALASVLAVLRIALGA
jgi:succinate dehydrogenase / fumarate reductase membrane anchor subunit